MKGKLIILLSAIASVTCAFGLSACGGDTHKIHTFDQKIVEEQYLKSEADCTHAAVYYYSCECGEKGTQTFEYGEPTGHTFDQQVAQEKYLKSEADCTHKAVYYYSCVCGEKGTETFEYGELGDHVYDQKVAEAKYLKSEATCTHAAEYYYSCVCGEKGTETFEYGELADHVYNQKVAEEQYLKTPATCTHAAEYYYSCVCGEKGTETFEYGELGDHVYDQKVAEAKYLKSEANCTHAAVYYYSCICGEKGTETFEYGEPNDNHSFVNGVCEICGEISYTEGLQFTLLADDTYSLTGIGEATETYIHIPATYKGLPVTNIGANAFANNVKIEIITIPESITSIGNGAFSGCKSLTQINFNATKCESLAQSSYAFLNAGVDGDGITLNIGENVKQIPDYLFRNANKITNVVFAAGSVCESIGDYAFSNCSGLESINLPASLTYIGGNAFADCNGLINVVIPDKVTEIGSEAFADCDKLTSITIGAGVKQIGKNAFLDCTSLTVIKYNAAECADLLPYNGVFSAAGVDGDGITVNIGATVKVIPAFLFSSNINQNDPNQKVSNIISVVFAENSVCTVIGNSAFYACNGLTSITLPASLTSIGEEAFSGCSALTDIYFEGTSKEWSDINKGISWDNGTDEYTVHYGAEN